jgi:hypothetical protein
MEVYNLKLHHKSLEKKWEEERVLKELEKLRLEEEKKKYD